MSEVITTYFNNNTVSSKMWVNDENKAHKVDGPAYIEYWFNGEIRRIEYWINGVRHRENKPAAINFFNDRVKSGEYYFTNDKIQRINGPAIIEYKKDGRIEYEDWYNNGIDYTYEVNKWLKINELNWKFMEEFEFNRMWFEIL